jgi:hypothetical protein
MARRYSDCYRTEISQFPITLAQRGPDDFRVTYGKQVKSELNYSQAARELGSCIMHALACESKIDNS